MFDKDRILSLLDRIEDSILLIQNKSGEIIDSDDFLLTQDGMFILSGICMQLIFIGESVKTIDYKTNHEYLKNYPCIPWTEIMGLRDIIAHEYHKIDEEEIFNVIKNDIPSLLHEIQKMKQDLIDS
ncbi:DUF86 domain-containing protein [Parabacteroides bouchesdurhonensis]|uniref:HepT-like ribonuclease domain-containing protein n=1 Tax=Parabacteroides bouchesdurhonensis TaxID=1936995 RepID=UPI000C85B353|nr:HepT-like ribonuclease domain-containing protein [Parabacteroides bouchesdurhonensis]